MQQKKIRQGTWKEKLKQFAICLVFIDAVLLCRIVWFCHLLYSSFAGTDGGLFAILEASGYASMLSVYGSTCAMFILLYLGLCLVFVLAKKMKKTQEDETQKSPKNLARILGKITVYYILFVCNTLLIVWHLAAPSENIFASITYGLMLFSIYYAVLALYRYTKDQEHHPRKSKKALTVYAVASVIILGVFVLNASNIMTRGAIGFENVVTGWSTVYNKDGTVKHDRHGNVVEDIDYEKRAIMGRRTNYSLLLYPALGIGLTYCFFVRKNEGQEQQDQKQGK